VLGTKYGPKSKYEYTTRGTEASIDASCVTRSRVGGDDDDHHEDLKEVDRFFVDSLAPALGKLIGKHPGITNMSVDLHNQYLFAHLDKKPFEGLEVLCGECESPLDLKGEVPMIPEHEVGYGFTKSFEYNCSCNNLKVGVSFH